jgi:branched-chain amino acid transport system substrate-binding protein
MNTGGQSARLGLSCLVARAKGRATAFAVALICLSGQAWSAESLRVGFVTSLTDSAAAQGRDALDGFMLGIKHSGSRLGGVEVEVAPADDQARAEAATAQAERLAERERLSLLAGPVLSETLRAVVKVGQAAGAPVIAIGPGLPELSGEGCRPGFFSLLPPEESLAESLGKIAAGRRVAIVAVDNEEGRSLAAAFQAGLGGAPLAPILVRPGRIEFQDLLMRLKADKPDGLAMFLKAGMGVSFLRQLSRFGLREGMTLYLQTPMAEQPHLAALSESALGAISLGPWSDDLDNPAHKRMVAEFDEEYRRPMSSQAALGYEMALLLEQAVKSLGGKLSDRSAFLTALARVQAVSPRGVVSFAANRTAQGPVFIREVGKDAKGRLVNHQKGVAAIIDRRAALCRLAVPEEPPPQPNPPKRP